MIQHTSGFYRLNVPPSVRLFYVLFTFLVLWIWYAKSNFYRDPGSLFYDESRAFDKRYGAHRETQAEEYLQVIQSQAETRQFLKSDADPILSATFLSVVRPNTNQSYFDLSLASALDSLTPAERRALNVQVFFPSSRPHEHDTFSKHWLRKVVDQVHTYESLLLPAEIEHARALETTNGDEKPPFDYALALHQITNVTNVEARYIAVFEDDVIFAEGWLARSILGLRDVGKRMKESHREGKWLYLRLFNQERSTGWASRAIGGNRELEISACISVVLLLILAIGRRISRFVKTIDAWTIVISMLFIPIFVIFFFQCGKASMLGPRSSGVHEEPFGCCAQALIFNRQHVDGLAEYIRLHAQEGHHDMLTRDYANQLGLARWTLYPTMTQHIGIRSSIQKGVAASESRKVWSMAFEDLNPLKLAREHSLHVEKIFGRD